MKKKKGKIDRTETFDEFLAKDGILAEIEDAALKEISDAYGERQSRAPRK